MANKTALRFLVSCRHCHRPIMTVAWSAGEILHLRQHLQKCAPDEVPADAASAEETVRHFRVIPVEGQA
ncbi:MAG: hypothetical protein E6J69_05390 [Deltaproteobacteria bacterium]|nr:MAG: hypothetical protein E6J69_05390 [Deltaproteobacteria bacterium]